MSSSNDNAAPLVDPSLEFLVEVNKVSFKYPADYGYTHIGNNLEDISFKLRPKDRVIMLGQNGSGKSTLLSLIGGQHMPNQGNITVLGTDAFDNTSLNHKVSLIGPSWPSEAYFANTVRGVTTPCPDVARRDLIAQEIHTPMSASIDKMSSGEKRRVQILFGMMKRSSVLLLDECSTDIDVSERITVLDRCRKECEELNKCAIYATHILDGITSWATHVALMEHGRLKHFVPVSEVLSMKKTLRSVAHEWMARAPRFDFLEASSLDADSTPERRAKTLQIVSKEDEASETREAVVVSNGTCFKHVLKDVQFKIYRGSRTLLIGCNGSGKSTLLNMMGSKQFFNNKEKKLQILGKPVFDDMSLNKVTVLCGDWWQATPGGQVHVKEMIPMPLTDRAKEIVTMLNINLDWDVRYVSAGELKRIQLFLRLYEPRQIIFLDEATADLDVDQRHMLLRYLYEESTKRNVTVVYATHIFEGLGPWATDAIVMDRNRSGVFQSWKAPITEDDIVSTLVQLKREEIWDL